jgi:hypothetical protein
MNWAKGVPFKTNKEKKKAVGGFSASLWIKSINKFAIAKIQKYVCSKPRRVISKIRNANFSLSPHFVGLLEFADLSCRMHTLCIYHGMD